MNELVRDYGDVNCSLGWSMKTPKYEIQKVYPFIRCVWAGWLWKTKFFGIWTIFGPPPKPLEVYVVNLLHSETGFSSSQKGHYKKVFRSC